jgi:hypothetical protein
MGLEMHYGFCAEEEKTISGAVPPNDHLFGVILVTPDHPT